MTTILDCSNIETTISSLETILGLDAYSIREFVTSFDCEAYSAAHRDDSRHLRYVLPELLRDRGASTLKPDVVCWFHGTRLLNPDTIRTYGLRSLHLHIDQIWNDLFLVAENWVSKETLQAFRVLIETTDALESSVRYRNRLGNELDSGPHAVLIRDSLVDPERFDAVDYLSSPETIEDVCESFKTHHQRDLLARFQAESVPCIVKFHDQCRRDDLVGVALSYLWCMLHEEPCLTCNACLEGDRNLIPVEAIVEVQQL